MKNKQANNLQNILKMVLILTLVSSCSLFRKKSTDDSLVKNESNVSGSSEKLDGSPLNMGATGSDSGSVDGLSSVFFEYDTATLATTEKEKISANAAWMKKNTNAKLTIEGHCDQRGSSEYNLALGERRANAVKQMLTSAGVPSARLATVSFGKEKPLVDTDTEEAMSRNRRANFVPIQ